MKPKTIQSAEVDFYTAQRGLNIIIIIILLVLLYCCHYYFFLDIS